ncbi:MAG: hypothetical protein ACRD88_14990 [Terriglobia bacterium]
MKRGLIHWDRSELPPAAFEARLGRVHKTLAEQELPALAVYSDVWRSNQARYLVNFMPYWNRSLAVIPQEGKPVLLCGLSPRVYPWIRSVTALEEIRSSGNPARGLLELASERQWKRVGILDLPQLPQEIAAPLRNGPPEITDVPSSGIYESGSLGRDAWELAMRRRAAELARKILAEQLAKDGGGVGAPDYHLVGRLERALRRAGAEDLVILLSNGRTVPVPARGAMLQEGFSVTVAMEYRGHWVKLSRPRATSSVTQSLHYRWESLLRDLQRPADLPIYTEILSGPYPYQFCDRFELRPGELFAFHVEFSAGGQRLFYGDSCWFGETGPEVL